MDEFDELFDVGVTKTVVDILPGTDLDELPAWVYAAISVLGFPIGLAGVGETEAVIAAIEFALRPVVSSMVKSQAVASIAKQLHQRVNKEIDDQIAGSLARLSDTDQRRRAGCPARHRMVLTRIADHRRRRRDGDRVRGIVEQHRRGNQHRPRQAARRTPDASSDRSLSPWRAVHPMVPVDHLVPMTVQATAETSNGAAGSSSKQRCRNASRRSSESCAT